MEEIIKLLNECLNDKLEQIILSNAKNTELGFKAKLRPVLLKGELFFQETMYVETKVYHENYTKEKIHLRIIGLLGEQFKQAQITHEEFDATVLVSKKGKITIKKKNKVSQNNKQETEIQQAAMQYGLKDENDNQENKQSVSYQNEKEEAAKQCSIKSENSSKQDKQSLKCENRNQEITIQDGINQQNNIRRERLEHNRTKQYILQEGTPVDFLVGLGVQSADGKISKNRYDKFRQINRYLEFIEDILDKLPEDRTIRIIDFGCGKSYLTFAMYYYLHIKQGRDIQVTGLDLKKDVIEHCNALARKLHYDNLKFERGDISTYEGADAVDMVVSLHACDTATDYALEKAIKWGARVIMAVPCCQHEINKQIKCDTLKPILKYGIIKEKMSALITDAIRANLLEQSGYDTQILEFIDMEHTPKNILIRAVKKSNFRPVSRKNDISGLKEFLNLSPTLDRLLGDENI